LGIYFASSIGLSNSEKQRGEAATQPHVKVQATSRHTPTLVGAAVQAKNTKGVAITSAKLEYNPNG
jgi:hypothetical protein